MQFLATAEQINRAFVRLLEQHDKVSMATAWASCDGPAYGSLFQHKAKIAKAVIGSHFLSGVRAYETELGF